MGPAGEGDALAGALAEEAEEGERSGGGRGVGNGVMKGERIIVENVEERRRAEGKVD